MSRVLITSVGTSAVGNWKRSRIARNPLRDRKIAKFVKDFVETTLLRISKQEIKHDILKWPNTLPEDRDLNWQSLEARRIGDYIDQTDTSVFSAETNTLWNLTPPVNEKDHIVLITSDTKDGELSGRIVETFLKRRVPNDDVEVRSVRDLANVTLRTTKAEERFLRGLSDFANLLKSIVYETKDRNDTPVIVGTGGFKAEIAVATVIGALTDVPVYYLHETLREVVAMPNVEINLPTDIVHQHWDFFHKAANDKLHQREKDSWCQADGDLSEYVERISEDSDYWTLNAAGLNLWMFVEPLEMKPSSLSELRSHLKPTEKIHLRSHAVEPNRPRQVDECAERIAALEWTHGIFYRTERRGVPDRVTCDEGKNFHVWVSGFKLAVTTPNPVENEDAEIARSMLNASIGVA